MSAVAAGTVRQWHDGEGWGVVDSVDTPGGCWAHFSTINGDGYKRLLAGQRVGFEWETADQDGFACRAVRVWRLSGL